VNLDSSRAQRTVSLDRGRGAHRALSVLAALLASLLLLFLAAPILRLVGEAGGDGLRRLGSDGELRASLALTGLTATVATLLGVLGGTPLAWLLARREFPGRAALSALLDLPLLIPHPVAGIALLLLLGRESAVGGAALEIGLRIVGSPLGIIAAMLFVSAPLFVSGAREAFAKVDARYEGVARTLGDPPWRAFRRVTLPLASRGLLASSVVMWARAVSEFGAIVILTYNPKVASVLSYDRFTSFGLSEALPVAAVLALLALVPLTLLRALRTERREDR
jgi:molybdate/tungstate transport system permease protein